MEILIGNISGSPYRSPSEYMNWPIGFPKPGLALKRSFGTLETAAPPGTVDISIWGILNSRQFGRENR